VPGYNVSVCGGCGSYATSLVLTFLLQATPDLSGAAAAWERDVFLNATAAFSYPGLRASYMAQRSIGDEIAVVASQNTLVVVASYAAMFVYIVVALGAFPHPVYTRSGLGLQAIAIVILSCTAAIGVCSAAGLTITMIVTEVLPFLILALGVDNVFIITKAFDRHWQSPAAAEADGGAPPTPPPPAALPPAASPRKRSSLSAEYMDLLPDTTAGGSLTAMLLGVDADDERRAAAAAAGGGKGGGGGGGGARVARSPDEAAALAAALGEVGPTVVAAAACEMLAFGLGATTDIPALKQFCIVACVAVAIDAALQLTWFASAVAADARRQAAQRFDAAPCWVRRRAPAAAAAAADDAAADAPPRPHACWRRILRGNYVRSFCASTFAPAVLSSPGRLCVLLAAVGALTASGVGLFRMQGRLGLPPQLAVPVGSYLGPYFSDQAALGEAGPPLYVVLQDVNFSSPDAAPAVEAMVEGLTTVSRWVQPPVASWLRQFAVWTSPASRAFVTAGHGASGSPAIDCPLPLPLTAPVARQIAQFLWDIPIRSKCCQNANYCSAQFSSDVKMLWGVPKAGAAAAAGGAPAAARADGGGGGGFRAPPPPPPLAPPPAWADVAAWLRAAADGVDASRAAAEVGAPAALVAAPPLPAWRAGADDPPVSAPASWAGAGVGGWSGSATPPGVDDGGCDLAYGYVPQTAVAAALAADGAAPPRALSSAVRVSGAALAAAAPPAVAARLAAGLSARFGVGAGGGRAAAAALSDVPAVTLVPCHVLTSRLRGQLTALRNQSDFVGSLNNVQAAVGALAAALPPVNLAAYGLAGAGADTRGPAAGDFVNAYNFSSDNEHTGWLAAAPGGRAFGYSLTFVYYEQYRFIRGTAAWSVLLTLGVVYAAAAAATGSLAVALATAALVFCVVADVLGVIWLLNTAADARGDFGVDFNAISVVNLIAAVGLAVEFGVHIAAAFSRARGTRLQRATEALVDTGSSIFSGITLTKCVATAGAQSPRLRALARPPAHSRYPPRPLRRRLVGVSVLSVAPSLLFRLYYFQIYFAIIICGAFNGLFVMPVVLSLVGWQADARDDDDGGSGDGEQSGAAYAAAAAAIATKELEPRLSSAGTGGPAAALPPRPIVATAAALGVAPGLAELPAASPSHASAYDRRPARGAARGDDPT
jgi:hypothetical protein